jgi:hypothetical protein
MEEFQGTLLLRKQKPNVNELYKVLELSLVQTHFSTSDQMASVRRRQKISDV